MAPFIGIATLRALNIAEVPEEVQAEPLGELAMRLLYRMRMASEQRPFDITSLFYIVPFIVLLMRQGGIGAKSVDDIDEQVILALDVLTYHTEICEYFIYFIIFLLTNGSREPAPSSC